MIKLTQWNIDDGGELKSVYFVASLITHVSQATIATPDLGCFVSFGGDAHVLVRESADEVARLVDEATGDDLPDDACFEQWAAHAAKMSVRGNRLSMTEDEYGQHIQFTVPFPAGARRAHFVGSFPDETPNAT